MARQSSQRKRPCTPRPPATSPKQLSGTGRPRLKAACVLSVTVVSAVLLLGSWLAQSHFLPLWLDRLAYLENTVVLGDLRQLKADMWLINRNTEQSRKPRNAPLLAMANYQVAVAFDTLNAWERIRPSYGEESHPIEVKEFNARQAKAALNLVLGTWDDDDLAPMGFRDRQALSASIKAARERGAFDGLDDMVLGDDRGASLGADRQDEVRYGYVALESLAKLRADERRRFVRPMDSMFFDTVATSRLAVQSWSRWLIGCYLLGSVLLAIRFTLVSILGWPSTWPRRPESVS